VAEPPPPVFGEALRPPRYGDRGSAELALALGYSSVSGFLGGLGFRDFVVDGLAPGLEVTYASGGDLGPAYGLVLATLRVVPVRTTTLALALTGRWGRVILGDHPDGWGVGGAASLVYMFSGGIGLEVGYELLKLYPASFCADLSDCVLQGPVLGLRVVL
jgi:hypothetical protein